MACNTKYPVVMVHGAGFRDKKHINYWGRIPAALEEQGAAVFYGHQDSWGSIEYNAAVLAGNIRQALAETGSEKVNIVAHSKGGLDARYMISSLEMAAEVASLTTVATPHHGSKTIDLLCKLPTGLFRVAAVLVNLFCRTLGDKNPDFFTASRQFSTGYMKEFNAQNPDADAVYYQSYAPVMKNPFSDLIMFWPNLIVGLVEGENDGLVTAKSAVWTNFRGILRGTGGRGISHVDEVDLRRRNFAKRPKAGGVCDIREFYIGIVAGLKDIGL
ncbi:MAG: hypothetical protein FWG53_11780 [Clostridiales bacterium]|nr:hypothetical protein [Clostridiales bacterium]